MQRLFLLLFLLANFTVSYAQQGSADLFVNVKGANKVSIPRATVSLLHTDSSIVKTALTDSSGTATFKGISPGDYIVRISATEHYTMYATLAGFGKIAQQSIEITLLPQSGMLQSVTVTAKRPFMQVLPDKTVINVEAGIGNAGSTVMDVLERSPGITVSRDGTISMKGKPSVMVLIDGKQTQLSGTELQAYLAGMSASQIDVIELIDNPGAKYDAAGNAGIINIRTKINKQKGFNGSLSLNIGQGTYWKSNNSLNLNYRNGKFNFYLNYGNRFGYEKMTFEALRTYLDKSGHDSLLLDQPNFTKTQATGHGVKTGLDFFAGKRTTFGLVFTGNSNDRHVSSFSTIDWMTPAFIIDSSIDTWGTRDMHFERAGVNLNMRHVLRDESELLTDLDYIHFDINGDQNFQTRLDAPGSTIQATSGNLPSRLRIITAKIDYSKRFKTLLLEAGVKTAATKTDNLAQYYFNNGSGWLEDLSRSNHFLYDEYIHSAYTSVDVEKGKWHWQGGLRYELTSYKANQLGNTVVKDSAFKRVYGSLFPSAFVSYNADSNNVFTVRFGRRIDRPQFQSLNPFLVTLNKYTFEGGNPFIQPQYTWKVELSHAYKQLLSTTLSYSYLKDYFSQIFIIDSNSSNINKNIIIYTRGNVGSFKNLGVAVTLQLPVTKWWNLTGIGIYNHKTITGEVWAPIVAKIDQLNFSLNNQFQFKHGWSAELSGSYQGNSQIDLQETVTPQGEVGFGVSKQILKGKGTLRFTVRDIFLNQNYSGLSHFENSNESFEVKWDSRVARLTFSWRFGRAMKAIKRSSGGSTEEIERVGSGN